MTITDIRFDALEKKVNALVKAGVKIQIQTSDAIAKLDKAVDKLRKALPHVNFED